MWGLRVECYDREEMLAGTLLEMCFSVHIYVYKKKIPLNILQIYFSQLNFLNGLVGCVWCAILPCVYAYPEIFYNSFHASQIYFRKFHINSHMHHNINRTYTQFQDKYFVKGYYRKKVLHTYGYNAIQLQIHFWN